MKSVIFIDNLNNDNVKPVEFTHISNNLCGWMKTEIKPDDSRISKIAYLGKCAVDGDMFSVYFKSAICTIAIFKDYLNSGKY